MRKLLVTLAAVSLTCVNVSVSAFSQVREGPSPSRAEFEAASIKPSASARLLGTMVRDGKLTATGISLKNLMAVAYDVREAEILGGPNWVRSERYDISAKAAGPASTAELKLMIRALREDRFQLKTRREMKEMPVYALIAAKNGTKLKPSNDLNCSDPSVYTPPPELPTAGQPAKPISIRCGNFYVLNDRLQGRKVSLRQLASTLSSMNIVEQRVVDQTGIAGTFDIDLQWDASSRRNVQLTDTSPDNTNLPSIFSAFEEQLGIKLQSQEARLEVLVIDNAMQPAAN